ncbi:MAG TPA: HAD-IC family P-type ATPase, partial [Planctomycetota bacterium]|nr:HAD-IC family P-type ATPase [Planctomycetota bacterium]
MDLELEIEGMRCAACAQTIEKALAKEPGVARASVNLALSRARVEVDPAVASPEKVIAAVRAAGYGARPAVDLARAAEDELSAARRDRVELALTALAAIPVAFLEHFGGHGSAVLGAVATLAVLLGGRAFFAGAVRAARARTPNMDVLVALGALAAISWSWLALLRPEFQLGHHLSFGEAALLVLFVRTGKALEGRARASAREALVALVSREPRNAMRRSGEVVPVASLLPGDEVVIRPGETAPVDGIIIDGSSSFDEALLTGESVPRERGPGDEVAGGTVNLARVVTIRAVRTGEDTALRKIARLVLDAQAEKAPIQRFADKAASVFVPAVLVLAAATGLVWKLALGAPVAVALARAVAVLVVACPCALGLATPVAVLVGSGAALRRGIL